jgi:hypothetical protein
MRKKPSIKGRFALFMVDFLVPARGDVWPACFGVAEDKSWGVNEASTSVGFPFPYVQTLVYGW